jgi:hypothetical protein
MITFDEVSKAYPDGTVAVDKLTLTAPNGKITLAENVVPRIKTAKKDDTATKTLDDVSAKLTAEDLISMNVEAATEPICPTSPRNGSPTPASQRADQTHYSSKDLIGHGF